MARRNRLGRLAALAGLAVGMLGCSAGSTATDSDEIRTTEPASTTATTATSPVVEKTSTTISTVISTAAPAATTAATTTTAAAATTAAATTVAAATTLPVAKTDPPVVGLPGEAAADAFCTTYGELAVSVYLVGLTEAFSTDPNEARRVEAAAGATIGRALTAALAALPVPALDDRLALEQRWTPYAERVRDIGDPVPGLWGTVVATHDRNDPSIELGASAQQLAALDAAAATIGGSYANDPAIAAAAAVATPKVDAYVLAACPDVAGLTIGDAV